MRIIIAILLVLTLTTGAKRGSSSKPKALPLSSVHLVDRNGFSETLSGKDRLDQFQNIDFLSPQPYQKVLRIYKRDSKGTMRSIVTTYHDNGNPKQFLEIVNGRAQGIYYEWHENGMLRVDARVISGPADVTPAAERLWLFDGPSYAWDDQGKMLAAINYSQGVLEDTSYYFHTNGRLWKSLSYSHHQLNGPALVYLSDGTLLQQSTYQQGVRHGPSTRYWTEGQPAAEEEFCQGKLLKGIYYDSKGTVVAEVIQGNGRRAVFNKKGIQELQEFKQGVPEGEVNVFNSKGHLKRTYHIKDGIKHGEEREFYPSCDSMPKLSFYWHEGKVQGIVRTWYPSGQLESQKEMANNKKSGLLTAWYADGNLMLIEEYHQDNLVRGDYFIRGENIPCSQVIGGEGTATLFTAEGHFSQRVAYSCGKPQEI